MSPVTVVLMEILSALFIEGIETRQVAGPSTRIDITGIQFSAEAEHGVPVTAEIMLLAAHGTLHLLLYDDMDEESSQIMRAKEKEYVPEAFREV